MRPGVGDDSLKELWFYTPIVREYIFGIEIRELKNIMCSRSNSRDTIYDSATVKCPGSDVCGGFVDYYCRIVWW